MIPVKFIQTKWRLSFFAIIVFFVVLLIIDGTAMGAFYSDIHKAVANNEQVQEVQIQEVQAQDVQNDPMAPSQQIVQNDRPIQIENPHPVLQAAEDPAKSNPTIPMQQYKSVEITATGYYAGKESTGKSPGDPEYGITFSGMSVKRDKDGISTIAADPKVFPIGTVLFIPGYGYGIVADTGSGIRGKKIDLYYETKEQVYQEWGKKDVTVYIVKTGPGKLTKEIWQNTYDEIFNAQKVDTLPKWYNMNNKLNIADISWRRRGEIHYGQK